MAKAVTATHGSSPLLSTSAPVGYGATELAQAYHLQGQGAKGTIAIIDAGAEPHLESDVAAYRKQYGLPPCTSVSGCFSQMDLHGGPPLKPDPKNSAIEETVAVETALDMDMASAACPSCKLVEVQTPPADVIAAGAPTRLPRTSAAP